MRYRCDGPEQFLRGHWCRANNSTSLYYGWRYSAGRPLNVTVIRPTGRLKFVVIRPITVRSYSAE